MNGAAGVGGTSSWIISSKNINLNFQGFEGKRVLRQSKPGSENQCLNNATRQNDSSCAKLIYIQLKGEKNDNLAESKKSFLIPKALNCCPLMKLIQAWNLVLRNCWDYSVLQEFHIWISTICGTFDPSGLFCPVNRRLSSAEHGLMPSSGLLLLTVAEQDLNYR